LAGPNPGVRPELEKIATPLQADQWDLLLQDHPDMEFTAYILSGISKGFRIGFDRLNALRKAKSNMAQAREHPEVVEAYLLKELERGALLGPFEPTAVPHVHISKFGVIPKNHQPGKWRLIVDLSSPASKSVNDGIPSDLCSLTYMRLEQVVLRVLELGVGAKMAKFDVQSAYRLVPVHPEDRYLLGMSWKGQVYVDAALPFGLRSAPKIFTALADAMEWIFKKNGVADIWHYLDDFITVGPPDSDECQANITLMVELCRRLGIPLADDKLVGACTCLVFLGIEIDTIAGEIRLPTEKLRRFKELVNNWTEKKRCTKRDLLSLIGQLQHATVVVRPGRSFLRRLIALSKSVSKLTHHLNVNSEARSDILWWHSFLEGWNGATLLSVAGERAPNKSFTSDASGSWGCGAHWETEWFQLAWDNIPEMRDMNIATQELLPIVIAAAIWGRRWSGLCIQCQSDNQAAVAVLASRSCRDKDLMHLLRCLFFFEAEFQFNLVAVHIPGKLNILADNLSRNDASAFFQQVNHTVSHEPTAIPTPLLEMLAVQRPDWTSNAWREMFKSVLRLV
jgi:hypothetical protein